MMVAVRELIKSRQACRTHRAGKLWQELHRQSGVGDYGVPPRWYAVVVPLSVVGRWSWVRAARAEAVPSEEMLRVSALPPVGVPK